MRVCDAVQAKRSGDADAVVVDPVVLRSRAMASPDSDYNRLFAGALGAAGEDLTFAEAEERYARALKQTETFAVTPQNHGTVGTCALALCAARRTVCSRPIC